MSSQEPVRPAETEYHEYYSTYVDKVPHADVLEQLASGVRVTAKLLETVPADGETFRYGEGKWSIREVIGHMLDTERVFGFRALWAARLDPAAQPGMDQDVWAAASNAHHRPLEDLLQEFDDVRRSHVAMFRGFDGGDWGRTLEASGCTFTVRALAYILVGHEIHHRGILEARYLPALAAP